MSKKERLSEAVWDENQNRWCCRVMVNYKRRAFYSSIPGRKGKREAERKADAWIADGAIDAGLRVGKLWQEFIEYERRTKGENSETYAQHEKYGRLYILRYVEHKKLEDMRPIDWQECVSATYAESRAAGKPLSAKTLSNIRGALTAFKRHCEDVGIEIRSMRTIQIPDSAPVGERKILQPIDIRALFQPIEFGWHYPHYINAWRFQVLTGLRPGEVYALMQDDITPDGMITVRRSVNVRGIVTDGKNRNARRTFLLSEAARDVLREQAEYLRRRGIITPYVFPAMDGSIASERQAYKAWLYFCDTHDITRCSLYELRHTMVSLNADVPDALLKPMVGHSQSMDTRGTYSHELQGNRERTARMIDSIFTSIKFPDANNDANATSKYKISGDET